MNKGRFLVGMVIIWTLVMEGCSSTVGQKDVKAPHSFSHDELMTLAICKPDSCSKSDATNAVQQLSEKDDLIRVAFEAHYKLNDVAKMAMERALAQVTKPEEAVQISLRAWKFAIDKYDSISLSERGYKLHWLALTKLRELAHKSKDPQYHLFYFLIKTNDKKDFWAGIKKIDLSQQEFFAAVSLYHPHLWASVGSAFTRLDATQINTVEQMARRHLNSSDIWVQLAVLKKIKELQPAWHNNPTMYDLVFRMMEREVSHEIRVAAIDTLPLPFSDPSLDSNATSTLRALQTMASDDKVRVAAGEKLDGSREDTLNKRLADIKAAVDANNQKQLLEFALRPLFETDGMTAVKALNPDQLPEVIKNSELQKVRKVARLATIAQLSEKDCFELARSSAEDAQVAMVAFGKVKSRQWLKRLITESSFSSIRQAAFEGTEWSTSELVTLAKQVSDAEEVDVILSYLDGLPTKERQRYYRDILANSKSEAVRTSVVDRITDQRILFAQLTQDNSESVQAAIIACMTNPGLLKQAADKHLRCSMRMEAMRKYFLLRNGRFDETRYLYILEACEM